MQQTQTSIPQESMDTWSGGETLDCGICGGAGWVYCNVPMGHELFGRAVPCSCRQEAWKKERLVALERYCELPPMGESMTFGKFEVYPEVGEAYRVAKKVASSPNEFHWVMFTGLNDTGKTHLAMAICQEWIKQGVVAKYIFVPLLLDELREGFGRSGDERYEARFKRFCSVPLLVLDDLGAESPTRWVNEKLETLVDYRYMNNLSLVVTTNKTPEELSPRLGSRLVRHPKAQIVRVGCGEYALRKKG